MLFSVLLPDVLLLALICVTSAASTSIPSQPGLDKRQTENWEKYVRAPSSTTVSPVGIVSSFTQGNVNNPEGLLTPGGDPTILTRWVPDSGVQDVKAQIVVDFGQNIVGYVSINFAGAVSDTKTGLPGVRLAFSESIQYGFLTDLSDFSRSNSVSSPVPSPTWITADLLLGRYYHTRKRSSKLCLFDFPAFPSHRFHSGFEEKREFLITCLILDCRPVPALHLDC